LDNYIESEDYLIEYDKFKGPISLLLELVQKKKENIYEIKLSIIIKGFIDYIKRNKNILIETISGFVYVASILTEVKSRSLIPSKRKSIGEEEGLAKDDILKSREEEYKIFKKISNYFSSLYEKEYLYYVREAPLEEDFLNLLPDFTDDININNIFLTASKLIKYSEKKMNIQDYFNHITNINIFDEMERIKDILYEKEDVTFKEISSGYKKVIEKIISFLSILELYKKGIIDIIQFESFGSILIRRLR
jgi:segregation and condensation protein A